MSPSVANIINYAVIVVYTLVVIGIGVYFAREKKNSETYLLGGRSMPSWAIGLACMMSLFSSISIVMVPGEIFNNGMTLFFLNGFFGPLLIIPCYLLFTRFYFRLGSFTPYEYLEYRYDSKIRAVVAFSSFYLRVVYIGTVLYTSSKIFEAGYGWHPFFSIFLVAGVGILCCFIGGSKAVVWTDVFQALVTFGGLLAVALLLCYKIDGGFIEAFRCAFADGHGIPQYSQPEFYTMSPYVRLLFWLLLWGSISSHLINAASDQVTIQRILSTRNWKDGLKSQMLSAGMGMTFMCFLYFTGFALYTYYKQNPDAVVAIGSGAGDKAFFHFVATFMPAPFSGLFMAAMLAAIMSTVSGVVNSMAAVWLKEFHAKFINRNLDEHGEFSVLRKATLILGGVGILLAILLELCGKWLQQSVAEVGTIFGLLGAAVLPAFLFAVLSKRANSKLIWAYTFWSFGEGIAFNVWYALSRSSFLAWQENNAEPWGWAGPISIIWVLLPLIPGLLLCIPYICKKLRGHWASIVLCVLGLALIGFAEGIFIWWGYSNTLIDAVPRARSFAFYLPVSLIFAFIALRFCPVQPRHKYQGLTIGTINQPVIKPEDETK